ncbi:MAG: histidine triad nucleotide-binding protein [Burkholderiales bacterium]|nr:histidine triad nucleotide-binding protein [Burkholderiales bacterium]
MDNCIFCKISKKDIPSKIIYEDEDIFVFHDINPAAEVHFLLIPKLHITNMLELNDTHQILMGKMIILANKLANEYGLSNGYKTQINTGKNGGQEVYHLHIHVFGNK